MLLPASKVLKVIKGATFNYPFQYFLGSPSSYSIQNLTGWGAQWVITWTLPTPGSSTLTSGASQGSSGVFFGGAANDLSNGRINMIIVPADTATIPWTIATYILRLTDPLNNVYQLLEGGMGVVS